MFNKMSLPKARNSMKWLVILFIFCVPFNANAGWSDSEIDDLKKKVNKIKNDVKKVKKNVNTVKKDIRGNISSVSDEFKEQVDILQSKGELLKETAEQLLDWLNEHKEDYQLFAGSDRCAGGSPCDLFRDELRTFVQDFSLLSDRFPIIEKIGLNDAPVLTKLLDRLPPIILFPLYETMQRMPEWREMPVQLSSIVDEIGDPDVFSVRLSPLPDLDDIKTPTERFCDNKADKLDNEIDQVRLNRIKLYISYIKSIYSAGGEISVPDTQTIAILGEGGSIAIPNVMKVIVIAIEFVQEAVGTYRANLDICRSLRDNALEDELRDQERMILLETQVAQCVQLVDFILPEQRDEIYNLVIDKVNQADDAGLPVSMSLNLLGNADEFRYNEMWKDAYLQICEAYSNIGK